MKTNTEDLERKIRLFQTYTQNKNDRNEIKEFMQIKELECLLNKIGIHKIISSDFIKITYSYEFEPWGRASETWEDVWKIEFTQFKFYYADKKKYILHDNFSNLEEMNKFENEISKKHKIHILSCIGHTLIQALENAKNVIFEIAKELKMGD